VNDCLDNPTTAIEYAKALHEAVVSASKGSVERARDAGEWYAEKREELKKSHDWLPFLRNAGIPRRTAQNYITICLHWGICATVAHMGVAGVLIHLRKELGGKADEDDGGDPQPQEAGCTVVHFQPSLSARPAPAAHLRSANVVHSGDVAGMRTGDVAKWKGRRSSHRRPRKKASLEVAYHRPHVSFKPSRSELPRTDDDTPLRPIQPVGAVGFSGQPSPTKR
jgi:hypothetical protein